MIELRSSTLIIPFFEFRKLKQVPRFYPLDRLFFGALVEIVALVDFESVVQTFPHFGADFGDLRKLTLDPVILYPLFLNRILDTQYLIF